MKQPIVAITSAFAILSLTGALGCGDDDGGSSSGVDGSKSIAEVTDADAKKVCEWLAKESASIQPSKKQICTAAAIPFSTTAAECNQFVSACVESGDTDIEEETTDCSDVTTDDVDTSCTTVTVAEYEKCVKAMLNGLNQQISSLSCADAGDEVSFEPTTPDACREIEEECPDLLEGLDGGDVIDVGGGGGGGTQFSCGDGSSIDQDWVCDEERDCENGRDELNCP